MKREFLEDVDLGFAFLRRFWGRGYAYESAAAVMAYGQAALGLKRIVAITVPDNDSSMALLKKAGFGFERMIVFPADGAELKLFAHPPRS